MQTLQQLRKRTEKILSDYRHAVRSKKEEQERLAQVKEKVASYEQAQALIQNEVKYTQEILHKQIAGHVSRCLKDVFGVDAYKFKIDFVRSRGRTEARLQFVRDGMVLENPKDQAGVGQVQIASLALRILAVLLSKKRRFIAADEPLNFVNGSEYQERVADLIYKLSEDMKMQFMLVCDDDWLKIGSVTEL